MHRFAPAAFLLLTPLIAQTALAQGDAPGLDLAFAAARHAQPCTIIARDSVSMNFTCERNGTLRQYWVTRGTRFLGPNASFFNLATGQPVHVTFHNAGRPIADIVHF